MIRWCLHCKAQREFRKHQINDTGYYQLICKICNRVAWLGKNKHGQATANTRADRRNRKVIEAARLLASKLPENRVINL
jgi:hypothetical protein